ncbi:zinc transporter ZIP1 isoform X2 [Dermacentor silvarum]|nr:zinc transporter ZIP1 isoform X2 [Dermacentor silvarum]
MLSSMRPMQVLLVRRLAVNTSTKTQECLTGVVCLIPAQNSGSILGAPLEDTSPHLLQARTRQELENSVKDGISMVSSGGPAVALVRNTAVWAASHLASPRGSAWRGGATRRSRFSSASEAAVLFATSFLHLLPEVREGFEKLTTEFPVTEGVVCVGFLAVYALEEIVHACLGHSHQTSDHGHSHAAIVMSRSHDAEQPPPTQENGVENKENFSANAVADDELGPQRISLGSVLIVVALSFHSIFEGLSLGLQSTDQATWIMFLAISIHKFVIAFVVGFDMTASRMKARTILIYIAIFSVMSPLGALIGAVTKNKLEDSPVVAGLNGVATGTLLYVTFFEVLQRDKNSQLSGLLQLLAVLLGFCIMLTLVLVLPHD